MRKRFLSLLLACCMAVAALLTTALAADIVSMGTCGANGNNLAWTLDGEGTLIISGTGGMEDYNTAAQAGGPWRGLMTSIKTVVVEDGATSLGGNAFYYASKLEDITIPNTVTTIGNGVFYGCSSLTNVRIPNSVTAVGDRVFWRCTALKSVTIPDSVTSIGANTFQGCTKLKAIFGVEGSCAEAYAEENSLPFQAVPSTDASYDVLDGGSRWNPEETDGLSFRISGEWESPVDVFVDGSRVDPSNYDVAGDGVITLRNEYLDTLEVGRYTLIAAFEDGLVQAAFEIQDAPDPVVSITFTDVEDDAFYADAVTWAVENGVTFGTGSTTFSPLRTCTRLEIVLFLYRAAGSPDDIDVSTATRFTDMANYSADSGYVRAVAWAVENGITFGTSGTTFSPLRTCTRAEIVTFLWRYAGKPAASADAPFTDVADGEFYAAAVDWATEKKITSGAGDNHFEPLRTCTRAEAVTFLYRAQA